jgi:hypothetical protein
MDYKITYQYRHNQNKVSYYLRATDYKNFSQDCTTGMVWAEPVDPVVFLVVKTDE